MPKLSPPVFEKKLEDLELSEGQTVRLEVKIRAEPFPKVLWYLEKDILKDGGRYKISTDRKETFVLEISNTSLDDEGEYRCEASNTLGKSFSTSKVFINGPGKIVSPPTVEAFGIGETLRLKIGYDGNPRPNVNWSFKGQPLKDGGRVKIEDNGRFSTLSVSNITQADLGNYSVRVDNEYGDGEASVDISDVSSVSSSGPHSGTTAATKPVGKVAFNAPAGKVAVPNQEKKPEPKVMLVQSKQVPAQPPAPAPAAELKAPVGVTASIEVNTKQPTEVKTQIATAKAAPAPEAAPKIQPAEEPKSSQPTTAAVQVKVSRGDGVSAPVQVNVTDNKGSAASGAFAATSGGRIFNPNAKHTKRESKRVTRPNIKEENPEKFYTFGEEIGRGKFSVVKRCHHKDTKEAFVAKIIKYDDDTIKYAIREYDLMTSGKMNHKGLVKLYEAYMVQKYLICILEYVPGETLLTQMAKKSSSSEEDAAGIIRQLLEILQHLHSNNIVHLDIRPTNIRFASGSKDIKLLDYNSARHIANKMAGEVVDVIGDTEFCAPEMLKFEPVSPGTDMWSIGVILYILLSGISPFYDPDEEEVLANVESVTWRFEASAFSCVSSEAKEFIRKCFIRIPEMRMTAAEALKHPWLSVDLLRTRKANILNTTPMKETDERLKQEEEEEYVRASLVFRQFGETEYESPESEEEDDDEDEE